MSTRIQHIMVKVNSLINHQIFNHSEETSIITVSRTISDKISKLRDRQKCNQFKSHLNHLSKEINRLRWVNLNLLFKNLQEGKIIGLNTFLPKRLQISSKTKILWTILITRDTKGLCRNGSLKIWTIHSTQVAFKTQKDHLFTKTRKSRAHNKREITTFLQWITRITKIKEQLLSQIFQKLKCQKRRLFFRACHLMRGLEQSLGELFRPI